MNKAEKYTQQILDYYDVCWLERFMQGHNPNSLAMHMGYFSDSVEDNDQAKLRMNSFIAAQLSLGNSDAQTVVDAGCGIGGTLFFLKEQFPQHHLIGINISRSQIAFAQQKAKPLNNIVFLEEDYTNTSLESNSVDVAYAIESMCHSESKEQFLVEMFRVLKPGGKLLIIDYIEVLKPTDAETMSALNAFQQGWAVNHYIDLPAKRLLKAGFDNIEVTSILNFVMPGIEKSYYGALTKMEQIKKEDSELLYNHYKACVSLKLLVEKGIIDYCVLQCTKPIEQQ